MTVAEVIFCSITFLFIVSLSILAIFQKIEGGEE